MFTYGAGPNLLLWVFLAELLPREYKVLSGIIVARANLPVFLKNGVVVVHMSPITRTLSEIFSKTMKNKLPINN